MGALLVLSTSLLLPLNSDDLSNHFINETLPIILVLVAA